MEIERYKSVYWRPMLGQSETPFSAEEGVEHTHAICGCAGRYDCDCVSVVNIAHRQLWLESNCPDFGKPGR